MRLKIIAISFWLLFTLSLSLWWLYFGLSQLELLEEIEGAEKVISQQRMLIWEGVSLVLSILVGGIALGLLAFKQWKERKRIEDFFSVFSHELKTPLTNIQLQAESLGASKLIESSAKLLVQLDNAMFVARLPEDLFLEDINLRSLIENTAFKWCSLEVKILGDAVVESDRRILEAIFNNIFSNAIKHGEASIISVEIEKSKDRTIITITDNGKGFLGERNFLGGKYYRFSKSGGTGLGLYLVKELLKRLQGKVTFPKSEKGFSVKIEL